MTVRASVLLLALGVTITASQPAGFSQDWDQMGDARKSNAFMLYQKAMQLHQSGDMGAAIEAYKQSLSFDPANKFAYYYLAMAYTQTGNDEAAIMQFKNALNHDYNFIDCRNSYGELLMRTGEREYAQKQFVECIKINPKYPNAYYHLGQIFQQKGNLKDAIEAYETATRLKPDYYEAQRDLGLAIYERAEATDISQAMDKLLVAARLMPDNPMIHYHLGNIYSADGKLDEAEAEFRKALMIDPQLAAAHWELARLRYYRGDPNRALQEIKEAERINPTYGENKKYPKVDPLLLKQVAAVCLETTDKLVPAVEAWKELSAMMGTNPMPREHVSNLERDLKHGARRKPKQPAFDPEEIDALVAKGQRQYDDGDLDGARASFQRALELNPQSYEAMQNLGECLEAEGDLNSALAKYQAAITLKPNFDGAYYNLAYLLEKLNLPAEAGMQYQKFHEIAGRYPYDPKHIVALQQEDARQRAKQEAVRRRGY